MIKYKQYMSGGIIGTETFNVGNPGNREVKGSLSNKGKVIKGKKSNKIIVTSGQLRQTGTSVRAKYGMTLDDYVDRAKEENPNIKLTMTPGQWLINPTENNEDAVNNDKKFNLMVQSSNVNVDLKGLHDIQSVYDNTISNFKKSIGNPDEENLDYWINSLFVPEAAKLKKQYPNDDLTFDKALKLTYDRYKYSQNNKGLHEGKDIATTHNNPGNIKYGEFAVKYGATPGKKATDGGVFAVFPSIEAGEEARRGLLRYGKNYRNLTVDEALKRWSNNGYNGSIVPNLAGLKIKDLTDDQFNQLSAAQIRSESNAMFNKLNKQHVPKNNSNEIRNQSGGETKVLPTIRPNTNNYLFKGTEGTIVPVENNMPQITLPEQEIIANKHWKQKGAELEQGYLPRKERKALKFFFPKREESLQNMYNENKENYLLEQNARNILNDNPYDRTIGADKYMSNLTQEERDILSKSQTWDKISKTYLGKIEQGLLNLGGMDSYGIKNKNYTNNEAKSVGSGLGAITEGGFGYLAKPLQGVTNAVGITNFKKADNSNYTVKDALQGKQNDAGFVADALTDVTNYAGLSIPKAAVNIGKILTSPENIVKYNKFVKPINNLVNLPLDFIEGIKTPLNTELKPITKTLDKPSFRKLREVQSLSSMSLDGNIPEDVLLNKYLKSSLNDDELLLLTGKSRKEIEQELLSLSSKPKLPELPENQLSNLEQLASYNGPEDMTNTVYNWNQHPAYTNIINRLNQVTSLDDEYFLDTSALWNNNGNIKSIFPNLNSDKAFELGQSVRNLFVDKSQLDEFVSILPQSEEAKSLLPALFKTEGETNEQIIKRMQEAINELKASAPGIYNAAGSLSSNSAPLYYTQASRLGRDENIEFLLDGFTELNSMGFLDKAGVSKEQILDFMNTHLSTLDFKGKKLPASYIDNRGQIQVPNLLIKKVGMGTIPLSIFFNSQRNNTDNKNQDIRKYGGQIKYKQYQSGSGNSDNALGDNTIPYTFYSESNILPAVEIKGKRRVGSSTVSLTSSDQPTNSEFKKKDNVKENLKWLAMLAADTAADQIPYSENVKAAYDVYKGHPVTGAVNYLKIPATPVVDALINMGQNNPTGIDTEHLDEWLLKNFNKNVFTKNLKTQSRPGLGYAKGGQIKYKQYVTK